MEFTNVPETKEQKTKEIKLAIEELIKLGFVERNNKGEIRLSKKGRNRDLMEKYLRGEIE